MSTSPGSGAQQIAPTANVTATFSNTMDPSTINDTTFKLVKLNADGTTTSVTAAVSYASATKKAILNPATNLKSGRTYKATVTTGAQDLAGNALDQDPNLANNQSKSWKFKVQ
jgi:Bacterial Ig-like domain